MTNDTEHTRNPHMFPKELLDRPIPNGIMQRGNRPIDGKSVAARIEDLQLAGLELARGLQEHIAEAVGLIDAGRVGEARAALDRAVCVLDSIDYSPLIERDTIEG